MILELLLAATVATGQAANSPAPQGPVMVRRQGPPPPRISGGEAVLPLDLSGTIPVFQATIAGKPMRIAFDTGAPGALRLSDTAVQTLGLTKVGEARASDPSGRNAISIPMYKLPGLSVGGIEIGDWVATGAPLGGGRPVNFDAIIGLTPFSGYVVTLDYAHARLDIRRGSLPPPDGKTVFEYRDDAIPRLPLTVEGRSIEAHLDTGNAAGAVVVPEAFAKGLANHAQAKVVGRARTVSNEMEISAFDLLEEPRVGTVALNARQVSYPSVIDLANIGSKALGGMVVRVDPANRRIALERPPAAP